MAKAFRRYYTGTKNDRGAPGKGSWQRESQLSDLETSKRFCDCWGHTIPEGWDACRTCGKSLVQIHEDGDRIKPPIVPV